MKTLLSPERIALGAIAILALMGLFMAIKARADLAQAIGAKAIDRAAS